MMDLACISEYELQIQEDTFNLFDLVYETMDFIKLKAQRKNVSLRFLYMARSQVQIGILQKIQGDR